MSSGTPKSKIEKSSIFPVYKFVDIPDLRLGPRRLAFGTPRGSWDPRLRTTALSRENFYFWQTKFWKVGIYPPSTLRRPNYIYILVMPSLSKNILHFLCSDCRGPSISSGIIGPWPLQGYRWVNQKNYSQFFRERSLGFIKLLNNFFRIIGLMHSPFRVRSNCRVIANQQFFLA